MSRRNHVENGCKQQRSNGGGADDARKPRAQFQFRFIESFWAGFGDANAPPIHINVNVISKYRGSREQQRDTNADEQVLQ